MESNTFVNFEDLLNAFDWVSASTAMENTARVSRVTGKIYWSSSLMELEEELPDDIDDATIYVAVPHKYDLDLGKQLVFDFTDEYLPQSREIINGFFHKRGAYTKFKDFLERKDLLETWYDYEAQAIEHSLREWCSENGLSLKA